MLAVNFLALAGFLIVNVNIARAVITETLDPGTRAPTASGAAIVIPPVAEPTGSAQAPEDLTVTVTTVITASTPISSVESPCSTEVSVTVEPVSTPQASLTVEPVNSVNYTTSGSNMDSSTSATGTTTTTAMVEPTHETSTVVVTRTPSPSNMTGSPSALPSFTSEAGRVGGSSLLGLLVALGFLFLGN